MDLLRKVKCIDRLPEDDDTAFYVGNDNDYSIEVRTFYESDKSDFIKGIDYWYEPISTQQDADDRYNKSLNWLTLEYIKPEHLQLEEIKEAIKIAAYGKDN